MPVRAKDPVTQKAPFCLKFPCQKLLPEPCPLLGHGSPRLALGSGCTGGSGGGCCRSRAQARDREGDKRSEQSSGGGRGSCLARTHPGLSLHARPTLQPRCSSAPMLIIGSLRSQLQRRCPGSTRRRCFGAAASLLQPLRCSHRSGRRYPAVPGSAGAAGTAGGRGCRAVPQPEPAQPSGTARGTGRSLPGSSRRLRPQGGLQQRDGNPDLHPAPRGPSSVPPLSASKLKVELPISSYSSNYCRHPSKHKL